MTQINLLPWREQERQTNKILFGITLAAFMGLTLIGVLFAHLFLKIQINTQKERAAYLQSAIDQTQSDITSLKGKAEKQAKILSRLNLIVDLRNKSYEAVRLLNLLIVTVPKTIVIQKVIRDNRVITISGSTDSDLQTTLFMRNIEAVKGYDQPVLNVINTQKSESADTRHFQIKVEQQEHYGS